MFLVEIFSFNVRKIIFVDRVDEIWYFFLNYFKEFCFWEFY